MKLRPLRLVLGFAALVVCLLGLRTFMTAGSDALALYYLRLSVLAWVALILLSALSAGMALLRWTRLQPRDAGASALFGIGLGLGLIAVATLALGAAGLAGRTALVATLGVFLIAGVRDLTGLWRRLPLACARLRSAPVFHLALWAVLVFFLLINLVRAYTPPYDYDSLEYHAAAPAAYQRAGRVFFIHDNVYANFPQNVEMLHFLGMQLTASPDHGATVGQMLGGVMGFLTALALYRMLSGLAGKETGLIAAAFFYTWPGVTEYSGMPYVELPLLFYATLAMWALLSSIRRKRTRPGPRGWIILAGAATGLAMGVKYTAALLVFVPLLIWIALTSFSPRLALKEVARRGALFVAVAVLCFGPWLLRNTINTGNPVYPLLYRACRNSNWDAQKDARWRREHSPRERSLKVFAKKAGDVIFDNQGRASMLLVVFIPFCMLATRRTRMLCASLAAHGIGLFLFYCLFAQHNERFLDVWIPILAALSALGVAAVLRIRQGRLICPILILLLLAAPSRIRNYLFAELGLSVATGADTIDEFFTRHNFRHYDHMRYLSDPKNVPESARILFLGEARTFYCRRDCVAPTVFDTHLLEDVVTSAAAPGDIHRKLKDRGITHLYVNTQELYRLQTTYRYSYQGRPRLGMLDGFDWGLFGRFAAAHLRLVKLFQAYPPGAETVPWSRWEEFRAADEKARAQKRSIAGHFTALYELR